MMSSISSGFSTKLGMVACGVLKNTRSEYSVTDRSAATSTNRGASALCEPSFGVTPWHCEHQRCESAKPLDGLPCAIVLEHASTTARPIKNIMPIVRARISAPVFCQPHGTLLCFAGSWLSFVAMHLWRTRCSGDPVSACQCQPKTAEIVATIRETTNSQENASRKDSSLGLITLRFP